MTLRLFSANRLGLRVLGLFLLAAAVPLLLLALLSQRAVDDALRANESVRLGTSARAVGMLALERLRLARDGLKQAAAADIAMSPATERAPLLAVLVSRSDGGWHTLAGGGETARLGALATGDPGDRLFLADASAGAPAIVLQTVLADGRRAIGVVNPDYLWDGAADWSADGWLCVSAGPKRMLYCSESAGASGTPQGGPSERWRLFLDPDFRTPDWTFTAGRPEEALSASSPRFVLPVAAAAGLALAVLLSLVQIRRTLKPLARLLAGTRALSERRFAKPIELGSKDEFGELAGAFNDMAARLGRQFDEIESLAAIDRDIVGRAPLAAIDAAIGQRLATLLDVPAVAVVQFGQPHAAQAQAHLTRRDAPVAEAVLRLPPSLVTLASSGHEAATLVAGTPEAASLCPLLGAGPLVLLPLVWGEQRFGFVAWPGDGPTWSEDLERQVRDLSQRSTIAARTVERERRLLREARDDALTGLLNRHGLLEALQSLLGDLSDGRQLAVLFIDLDRFKKVNDTLGHGRGDEALMQVAARLRGVLPEGTPLARPAGDEFVALLPGADDAAAARHAAAVCSALAATMSLMHHGFQLGASVGIALCADARTAPSELLLRADYAMYEAKRDGGGRHAMWDDTMEQRAARRAWIERDLPLAADAGQLRLLYQPRIDRASGRMASVEALIRWHHPTHGLCSPADFIPVAESIGLIEAIGRWVIDAACAQASRWQAAGIDLPIAVNLSARQLASDGLVDELREALARHGIASHRLELEITESLFVDQTEETIARLHALRDLGLVLALDDFGTGYSSMSYLRTLPLDVLKIDRAFVSDLASDRSALAVARTIVALAASLGLRTVAEGVETEAQLTILRDLGCDEFQGYLFSPPVDADRIVTLLRQREARPAAALA